MSFDPKHDKVKDTIFLWLVLPFLVVMCGVPLLALGFQFYNSLMQPWSWFDIGKAVFIFWGSIVFVVVIFMGCSR